MIDSDTRQDLRRLLVAPGPLVVPFAYDAFSARLIERAGFSAVGVSGSAVAASLLGVPDVGLMSREEVVGQARRIAATISLPVIADADTGYGGPLQAARTVQDLEAAGVAGLFMEDQRDPKRCGHLAGTEVIPTDEMVGKLTAALESRADPNFVIIARTDAIESEGLEGAALRARTYLDAGADAVKSQVIFADELTTPEHQDYRLFQDVELPPDKWIELRDMAHDLGMDYLVDVFGLTAAQIVRKLKHTVSTWGLVRSDRWQPLLPLPSCMSFIM